jgi:hypothetical protein
VKSYSSDFLDALAEGEVVLITLVKLEFPSGTIGLNTSNYTFSYGGTEYRAANGLGQISPVTDGSGDPGGIKLELQTFDSSHVSLALDDEDEVQDSPVEIRTALLDLTTHQFVDAALDWAGYADTMTTSETGDTGSIMVSAESKGVDLLRGNPLVYDDPDQQSLVAGDKYLEYVVSQSDHPIKWPAAEWFYKK